MAEDVTQLLRQVNSGSDQAYAALMDRLYHELRRLAGGIMRSERPGHTLQPTALVNEAFLRLAGGGSNWENRAHFFGAAARAMRRVLVDHARKKTSQKRGGDAMRVTFEELNIESEDPSLNLMALDEALTALAKEDKRLVEVVELRYFAGCNVEQTAELLHISPATVKRDWAFARAWLYDFMN